MPVVRLLATPTLDSAGVDADGTGVQLPEEEPRVRPAGDDGPPRARSSEERATRRGAPD